MGGGMPIMKVRKMMDNVDLLNAARMIKDFCEHLENCAECPFLLGYDPIYEICRCTINDSTPQEWELDRLHGGRDD